MRSRPLSLSLLSATILLPVVANCSAPLSDETGGEAAAAGVGRPGGASNTGGVAPGGASNTGGAAPGGASPTGGSSGGITTGGSGGAITTGGSGGAITTGGSAGTGLVAGDGGTATGGTAGGGMGGTGGTGVTGGTAGTSTGGSGGFGGVPTPPALDCGGKGTVLENHGAPSNRVNYVIVADGYSQTELNTGGTLDTHLQTMTAKMYSDPIGQPFLRYRNFINICVLRIPSTPICGSSAFGCCGSDSSRLATCNSSAVTSALSQNLPASFEVTWRAVVLNGSSWWNTGSSLMLWSGGNRDAAGAALHEGGHGFNQLADEYGDCTGANCGSNTMGSGSTGTVYAEVNSAGNPMTTDGKWNLWVGTMQTGATGLQGTWSGSRYVGSGQYRPSANSMMNSLFGNNVNTSFNSVSREQIVFSIWRNGGGTKALTPIDSTEPPAGAADNPAVLRVNVIDPNVISVDWTVDGATTVNGGPTLSTASLSAGTHMISAKAYDNASMDLVKYRTGTCPSSVTGNYCHRTGWNNATQTVAWTVTKR